MTPSADKPAAKSYAPAGCATVAALGALVGGYFAGSHLGGPIWPQSLCSVDDGCWFGPVLALIVFTFVFTLVKKAVEER